MQKRHRTRAHRRLVPQKVATVSLHGGAVEPVYGVVANISEDGVCVVTDRVFESGFNVTLALSFYHQPKVLELESRVVWNRGTAESTPTVEKAVLHGIEFVDLPDAMRSNLKRILDSADFK